MTIRVRALIMIACNVALCLSGGVALVAHGVSLRRLEDQLDYSAHRAAIATLRSQSCNPAFDKLLNLAENETGELASMARSFGPEGRLFLSVGIALVGLSLMTAFVGWMLYGSDPVSREH